LGPDSPIFFTDASGDIDGIEINGIYIINSESIEFWITRIKENDKDRFNPKMIEPMLIGEIAEQLRYEVMTYHEPKLKSLLDLERENPALRLIIETEIKNIIEEMMYEIGTEIYRHVANITDVLVTRHMAVHFCATTSNPRKLFKQLKRCIKD